MGIIKKKKTVEQAYDDAIDAAGGGKSRWQKFKENALVQGFSSGVQKFGRFGMSKLSHASQDLVAGYRAFKVNRKDRHAVDDWGNNLDYLAGRGVTFTMQEDGSFRAEGTTDAGRALLKRIESAFGGRASDGQQKQDAPDPGKTPAPDTQDAAKDARNVPDTSKADTHDPGGASPEASKGADAGKKDAPAVPDTDAGKDSDAKVPSYDMEAIMKSLQKGSVSGFDLDTALSGMIQNAQAYLALPAEERDKMRGKMFMAAASVGQMGVDIIDRGKTVDGDLGTTLPDTAQGEPGVQAAI